MIKLILLLIFIIFNNVNSIIVTLNNNEYNCLQTLIINLGTSSKLNNSTGYIDFCSYNQINYPIQITCSGNITNATVIGLNLEQQSSNFVFFRESFLCFNNLTSLTLNNPFLSKDFLPTFPTPMDKMSIYTNKTDGLTYDTITPLLPNVEIYVLTQRFNLEIPFSYFVNTTTGLTIRELPGTSVTNTSHLFIFINDLSNQKIWRSLNIDIMSTYFPSFDFVVSQNLSVYLVPGFDIESLNNYLITCKNISNLSIRTGSEIQLPSDLSQLIQSNNLISMSFRGTLSKPIELIDLSLIGNKFNSLTFDEVGNKFSINGKLPFILPLTSSCLKSFTFKTGNITTLDLTQYQGLESLNLVGNDMNGQLPSIWNTTIFKNMKNLDLSYNNLTGTIDNSYCMLDLKVKNNSLNGNIPSCFTCYFIISSIKDSFSGNKFLIDINNPPPCNTIIPNIKYDGYNSTSNTHKFYVYGQDLGGYNIVDAISNGLSTSYPCTWKVEIPNKLLSCTHLASENNLLMDLPPRMINLVYNFNTYGVNVIRNFTLSINPLQPQINVVDWKSKGVLSLTFDGSYFSYNTSLIRITIGYQECIISSATFYQINCTLQDEIDPELSNIITYITVGNLITQITLNPGVLNIINTCEDYNDCSGNGYCISESGTCKCISDFNGKDCSLPSMKKCPNNCNRVGKCNTMTGICSCPTSPYGWQGEDCSIPSHYISSIIPSDTNGGNSTLYGWFGNIHEDLRILIGNKECTPVYIINDKELICNAPPGNGLQVITVIQNSLTLSNRIYQYNSNIKTCPNDCTSSTNGNCNSATGFCECINNWYGFDCSLYSNKGVSNTTIDNNGNTNINNQQTNYQLSITSLLEIDFNSNIINEYPLLNQWSINSNLDNGIITFIQSIQNNQCNITYSIEEIKKDRDQSFAGIQFKLDKGSVKMTITIENYQYSSNLNTLQLQMLSSVNNIESKDGNNNDCNDHNIEIESISTTIQYVSIKKDGKVLNGRFLDRIESDGISTFISTSIVSKSNDSITVGMNLPHCTTCIIDPDFSVLVSPDFSECNTSNKPWLIPVSLVVPVVGLTIIVAIAYVIYKIKFVHAPFQAKLKIIQNLNKNQ